MNMIYKNVFILLAGMFVACTFNACQHNVNYENCSNFSWNDFAEAKTLDSVCMNKELFLSQPLRILCIDSILFVQNRSGEFFLQRYTLPFLHSQGTDCIPFGHGPEEVLSIHRMQMQDSLFWLSDNMERCCIGYNRKDVLNKSEFTSVRKVCFDEPFSDIVALPDSGFVATVLHPEYKRLSFLNSQGLCYATVGDYPDFGVKLSALEQIESYICEMVVDDKNGRVWLFYMLTDLIEIYDLKGNLVKRMQGPDCFFPAMKEMSLEDGIQKVASVPGETQDAYFCPLVSGDKVYVLYSGRAFSPDRSLSAYLLNHLLVFDLNGEPYKHYQLSTPIYTFTIDEIHQVLYGLSFDPEYHLVKYQL